MPTNAKDIKKEKGTGVFFDGVEIPSSSLAYDSMHGSHTGMFKLPQTIPNSAPKPLHARPCFPMPHQIMKAHRIPIFEKPLKRPRTPSISDPLFEPKGKVVCISHFDHKHHPSNDGCTGVHCGDPGPFNDQQRSEINFRSDNGSSKVTSLPDQTSERKRLVSIDIQKGSPKTVQVSHDQKQAGFPKSILRNGAIKQEHEKKPPDQNSIRKMSYDELSAFITLSSCFKK